LPQVGGKGKISPVTQSNRNGILLFSISLLAFLCSSPPRNTIIFCAGDSITAADYPLFLQKLIRQDGIKAVVRNHGRAGHTSGEYLRFLLKNRDQFKKERPDFVLIQLGTNDVREDRDSTSLEDFRRNMRRILGYFREFRTRDGKQPVLLVATIPPIPEDSRYPFAPGSRQRVTAEINPAIIALSEKENIRLVDNHTLFLNSPSLLSGVHPTEDGYRALAKNWREALTPLLK
jgi:lysophospholipase L1-like esterase